MPIRGDDPDPLRNPELDEDVNPEHVVPVDEEEPDDEEEDDEDEEEESGSGEVH